MRQIAGGDTDVPSSRPPFGQFIICERARRHGENRLAFQRWIKQFEDVGLSRTGWRLNDDIFSVTQSAEPLPVARYQERRD